MSDVRMHILLELYDWTSSGQDGKSEIREELELRFILEAPTPHELEYQEEYLDYPIH